MEVDSPVGVPSHPRDPSQRTPTLRSAPRRASRSRTRRCIRRLHLRAPGEHIYIRQGRGGTHRRARRRPYTSIARREGTRHESRPSSRCWCWCTVEVSLQLGLGTARDVRRDAPENKPHRAESATPRPWALASERATARHPNVRSQDSGPCRPPPPHGYEARQRRPGVG